MNNILECLAQMYASLGEYLDTLQNEDNISILEGQEYMYGIPFRKIGDDIEFKPGCIMAIDFKEMKKLPFFNNQSIH